MGRRDVAESILLICVVLAVATVVAIVYGASRWEVGTKAIRAQLRSARVPITPATYDARELEGCPRLCSATFARC